MTIVGRAECPEPLFPFLSLSWPSIGSKTVVLNLGSIEPQEFGESVSAGSAIRDFE